MRPPRPSARAAALLACLVAALAAGGRAAAQGARAEPFARESELRREALFGAVGERAWRERLASGRWTERAAALDAATRALAAGLPADEALFEALARAADDPHPNVRTRALEAWGEAAVRPLPVALARRRLDDVFPAARGALARAIERAGAEQPCELLAPLVHDPDARVRRAARLALAARVEECEPLALELVGALVVAGEREALVELALSLADAVPSTALLERLGAIEGGDQGDASTAVRALFEAVRFAVHGRGDARALVAAWPALERSGAASVEPAASEDPGPWGSEHQRLRLLVRAARAGDPALARALLEALRALERAPSDGGGHEALAHAFAEAALEAAPARAVLAAGLALELGASWGLLAPTLAAHLEGWDPERGRALRARAPMEALDAFETTFVRRGDAGSARLLAEELAGGDARRAERAFRTLASPRGIELEGAALAAAWRAAEPERARRWLALLPRDAPFVALREDLLALGERGGDRRRVAVELLAPFRGDAGVAARLERWLDEDLTRWERALARDDDEPVASAGASEASGRTHELWVRGDLRALARVAPASPEAGEAFVDALERSLGRSDEIGSLAAEALAASPRGRATLAAALRPPAGALPERVEGRSRVEAALGLAAHADEVTAEEREGLVAILVEEYPRTEWDLGVRVLAALGRLGAPRGLAFLENLVRASEVAAEQRLAALEALGAAAARGEPLAATALGAAARDAAGLEARATALRALGGALGAPQGVGARAEALLGELAAELFRPAPASGAEAGDHLREALLAAWRDSPRPPPDTLRARWLERALAEAPRDLERRLDGEDLPAASFRWRGELDLTEALARHGLLGAALMQAERWWTLDARLLLALAARADAREEPPAEAVDALVRGALVGVLGEPEPAPDVVVRARSHLLASAGRRGDHEGVERQAAALLSVWRDGGGSEEVWRACLGPADRAAGLDPLARLASLRWQARAWRALQADDRSRARRAAARAERCVGASRSAAGAQERLEAALGEAYEIPREAHGR